MNDITVGRIIRASAIYDLVATAGFAIPISAGPALTALGDAHRALGLTGAVPQAHDPFTMLLANLLGSIVVVWSVVRVVRPEPILGAADTVARALFATWFVRAMGHGATPLLTIFLVGELAWGAVQGYAVLRAGRTRQAEGDGRLRLGS